MLFTATLIDPKGKQISRIKHNDLDSDVPFELRSGSAESIRIRWKNGNTTVWTTEDDTALGPRRRG